MNTFYFICGMIIGATLVSIGDKYKQHDYSKTEPVTVQDEPVEPELRWYDDVSNESRCYYLSTNSTNISCAYLVGGSK